MLVKLLAAGAMMAFGMTAASAQSCDDVINARQTLMKGSGAAAKTAFAMIKGETPYDPAKAQQVFAAFAEDADKMPKLFPDCSKTGDHTTAAPQIWDRSEDFQARIAKFAADVKAGQQNTKDLETFKTNVNAISKDCNGCHQTFRVRSS